MARFDRWSHEGPSGSELEAVQKGIDATMAEIIRRPSVPGPSSILGPPTQSVKRQPEAVERELRSPPGQDIVEQIADHFAPHGPKSPLRRREVEDEPET